MYHVGRYFSLLVLVLSALAHVTSYFPSGPVTADTIGPLHLGAMAVFFLMVLAQSRLTYVYKRTQKEIHDVVVSQMPRDVRVAVGLTGTYVFLIMVLFMRLSINGMPEKVDTGYVIQNKGKILRPSDEAEFRQGQQWLVRYFSAGAAIFSLIPFLFFTYAPRKMELKSPPVP